MSDRAGFAGEAAAMQTTNSRTRRLSVPVDRPPHH